MPLKGANKETLLGSVLNLGLLKEREEILEIIKTIEENKSPNTAQWAMIWTKPPLKPKSTNAFGYCRTSFGRYRMTWNLSLAPFRALKMPKKGLKTTKKCLFGYSEASYVTQIHFFSSICIFLCLLKVYQM